MQLAKIIGVSALAMVVTALPAMAQPESNEGPKPFLMVTPSVTITGVNVGVQGTCGDTSSPMVTSPGFAAPIKLGGYGKVSNKPGKYTATMKCKDKVLTASFEVILPAEFSVTPKRVEPGGKLTLQVRCPTAFGDKMAKSEGFASDIAVDYVRAGVIGRGTGKATTKPGSYAAIIYCDNEPMTARFTVAKGKPTPQPPQVVVKPKGAPQTGGGFLAG